MWRRDSAAVLFNDVVERIDWRWQAGRSATDGTRQGWKQRRRCSRVGVADFAADEEVVEVVSMPKLVV